MTDDPRKPRLYLPKHLVDQQAASRREAGVQRLLASDHPEPVRIKDLRLVQTHERLPILLVDIAAPDGLEQIGAISRDMLAYMRATQDRQRREREADEEAGVSSDGDELSPDGDGSSSGGDVQ